MDIRRKGALHNQNVHRPEHGAPRGPSTQKNISARPRSPLASGEFLTSHIRALIARIQAATWAMEIMRLRLGCAGIVGHVALSCLAPAPRASVSGEVAQLRIRVPEH